MTEETSIKKYKMTKPLLHSIIFGAIATGQCNPNVHPSDLTDEFMETVKKIHLFEDKNEVKE